MTVIAFLPYLVAAIAVGTLVVAIWSLQWPRVKGTIDVSIFDREWEVETTGSETTLQKRGKFYLAYSYAVEGITFQGSRISPLVEFDWQFSSSPDLSSANDRSKWYRKGASVDVSYCPFFPKWSCLEPGGFAIGFLLGVVAAILFYAV